MKLTSFYEIQDIVLNLFAYERDDEMTEKIKHYLKNKDERKKIAIAGQKKVLEHYTYKKQMEKIFDWVTANCKRQDE